MAYLLVISLLFIGRSFVLSNKLCIDLYLADKFGDGWGSGSLKIFDSHGSYKSFAPACDKAVSTSYCFDSITARDGDHVTITVLGFEPYASWEIVFEARIRDSGVTYTGTYNTWMRFTYSHLSNVTLTTSEFIQPNGLGPIVSCLVDNPSGRSQYWENPTAAPLPLAQPSASPVTHKPAATSSPIIPSIAPIVGSTKPTAPSPAPTVTIAPVSVTSTASPSKLPISKASSFIDTSVFVVQAKHNRRLSEEYLEVTMDGRDDTWYASDPGVTYNVFNEAGTILFYEGTLTARVPSAAPTVSIAPTSVAPIVETTSTSTSSPPPPPKNLPKVNKPEPSGGFAVPRVSSRSSKGRRLSNDRVGGDDCSINLAPGTYHFRVTGNGYAAKDDVSWTFCGYSGKAQEELVFSVDEDGQCTAVGEANFTEFCTGRVVAGQNLVAIPSSQELAYRAHPNSVFIVPSYTVLKGVVNLGGLATGNERLTVSETLVLQEGLAKEFSEAYSSESQVPAGHVSLLSWNPLSESQVVQRKLSGGEKSLGQLTFEVKVEAERLGVSSSNAAAVREMVQKLQSHLSLSVRRGVFVAKLTNQAISAGQERLQHVNFAEFLELTVVHETVFNAKLSGLGSIVVVSGGLAGIVFAAVLLKSVGKTRGWWTRKPYEKLAVESEEEFGRGH